MTATLDTLSSTLWNCQHSTGNGTDSGHPAQSLVQEGCPPCGVEWAGGNHAVLSDPGAHGCQGSCAQGGHEETALHHSTKHCLDSQGRCEVGGTHQGLAGAGQRGLDNGFSNHHCDFLSSLHLFYFECLGRKAFLTSKLRALLQPGLRGRQGWA